MDSPAPSADPALFTCLTCHVGFRQAELQRGHYKTEWHRYNLQRKVADLPPVTIEQFQQRVHNQRNVQQLAHQPTAIHCLACKKSFGNQKAHDNHIASRKHKINARDYGTDADAAEPATVSKAMDDIEEVDSDEWETENPIDNNDCLFCSHHSRTLLKNLDHMTIAHSFFIPDVEYCVDVLGLLRYLGEKVSDGFRCLWCSEKGRSFHTADAARQHMLDKGHCRMLHEGLTLAEYADYYDYSSSYPDANDDTVDVDEEMLDESGNNLDGSEYQLVLPSGATVGHRSLMRYYRQSLDPNSRAVAVSRKLHPVVSHYRCLGWAPTNHVAAARKAKDLRYMQRVQAKYGMKLGVQANKLQTHFRRQVNF